MGVSPSELDSDELTVGFATTFNRNLQGLWRFHRLCDHLLELYQETSIAFKLTTQLI